MVDITPTFDFGKDEIPTMATLTQQALSLQVSNLTASDFVVGTLGIFSGADSTVTGSSLVLGSPLGSLWVDATGNLWVKEAAGDVRIYRFHTGWESRRIWSEPDSPGFGSIDPPPGGAGVQMQAFSGDGDLTEDFNRTEGATTHSDGPGRLEHARFNMRNNGVGGHCHGLNSETGVSGFQLYCGRGGHPFYNVDVTSAAGWSYDIDLKDDFRLVASFGIPVGGNLWQHYDFGGEDFLNTLSTRFLGYVSTPMSGSSASTDGTFETNGFRERVQLFGYHFGIPKLGNFETAGINP